MKQIIKILGIMLLASTVLIQADCDSGCGISSFSNTGFNGGCGDCGGCSSGCSRDCDNDCCSSCHSLIMPRSANDNTARRIDEHYGHRFDADCFNGGLSLAFEYQRSFRGDRIAQCLFGGTNTLNFVGADVLPTTSVCGRTLLGTNFGISPFASQSLTFHPRIDSFIGDISLYFGLDEWACGLYFRLQTPIVHSRWNLRTQCGAAGCIDGTGCCSTGCSTGCSFGCSTGCSFGCSTGCSTGCNSCDCSETCSLVTTPFPAGAIAPFGAGTVAAAGSLQQALSGDFLFGGMQTPWRYGRFNFCNQTDTKLSDIDLTLGYDFWNCEDYHVGLFLRAVAPTGTKLNDCWARNFFSPIIGNGHHWELGGGLTSHVDLWNCNDDHIITMYIEGNVTHMFRECQVRSFDFLNNGCLSRYLLLQEFTSDATTGVFAPTGNLINAINFNTRRADVSVDVKGDASIKFVYRHCGWRLGVGYNVYGRTCENVCLKGGFVDSSLNGRSFGILGCSPVEAIGFTTAGGLITAPAPSGATFLLGATSSDATIGSCGTTDDGIALINPASPGFIFLEPGVTPAVGTPVATLTPAVTSGTGTLAIDPVTGAVTGITAAPGILTGAAGELDVRSGAAPRQLTNKIFGTVDYEWIDCDWSPFIGVGAEGEFASRRDCCSINQWGVWIKGGLSY